jgi:iron complex outermembrane receptor protein
MRGVNTGGVASTVAIYMDETPFGSSSALVNGAVLAGDFDTFDVARIEVLRGPQGTLYGASSMGGLLKFVTNTPDTGGYSARGRVSVEDSKGGDLSYRTTADGQHPAERDVAVRASGFYRKEGGFIDSIGTGRFGRRGRHQRHQGLWRPRLAAVQAERRLRPAPDRRGAGHQGQRLDRGRERSRHLKTLYGRPTLSQYVPSVFGRRGTASTTAC